MRPLSARAWPAPQWSPASMRTWKPRPHSSTWSSHMHEKRGCCKQAPVAFNYKLFEVMELIKFLGGGVTPGPENPYPTSDQNGIPDQTDGIYTLFQTKMAKSMPYFRLEMLENDTLWGGIYLYGLYMEVPRPLLPAPPDGGGWTWLTWVSEPQCCRPKFV